MVTINHPFSMSACPVVLNHTLSLIRLSPARTRILLKSCQATFIMNKRLIHFQPCREPVSSLRKKTLRCVRPTSKKFGVGQVIISVCLPDDPYIVKLVNANHSRHLRISLWNKMTFHYRRLTAEVSVQEVVGSFPAWQLFCQPLSLCIIFKHFPLHKQYPSVAVGSNKPLNILPVFPHNCKALTPFRYSFHRTWYLSPILWNPFPPPHPSLFFSSVLFFILSVTLHILLHHSTMCGSLHHPL